MGATGYADDADVDSREKEKERHHRHAPSLLLSHISFSKQNREKKKIDDVYNPIIDIDAHALRH
jgi:hypothetical protein